MSLYKDASLVMIPTAYKDGKLYSIRPTDGSGDFTFSRGSNLAATRVDVNGLIEKGRENLLLQSNNFGTTWAKSSATIASGQSGYDGSNNAWNFTTSAAGASLEQSVTTAGVVVVSLYAKANGINGVRLRIDAATDANGYFNLSTGAVHSFAGSAINASITSVGGGWYRCEVAANISSPVKVAIYTTDGTTSYDNGSILIQDSQYEQGLVATDYIETTTTSVSAGILEDMPRLDYSGGASCPSLLLEPQRTNLLPSSEDFSNSAWGKANVTLTSNNTISPDGTQNASKIVATASDGSLQDSIAVTSGTTYTFSVYLKTVSGTLDMAISLGSPGFPQNEGEGGRYKNITVTNEWKRYTLTSTADASASTGIGVGGFNSFSTGEEVYVWGAQLEAGSYPTSYIPTYGTSQTRSVDSCLATGVSDLIGQTQGTLFAEFEIGVDNAHFFLYTNISNAIYIQTRIGDMWRAYVIKDGVYQVSLTLGSVPTSGFVKMAFAYNENDFALYANGNLIVRIHQEVFLLAIHLILVLGLMEQDMRQKEQNKLFFSLHD
jgi:hypothetical protein